MRENGLRCASYAPVADLPAALADLLLATLRSEGIAAYAMPLRYVPDPARGRPGRRPAGPVEFDRLFADATRQARAQEIVRAHLARALGGAASWPTQPDIAPQGGPPAPGASAPPLPPGARAGSDGGGSVDAGSVDAGSVDADDAWAQLVAHFHDPVPPAEQRWPAAEDLPDAVAGTVAAPLRPAGPTRVPATGIGVPLAEPPGGWFSGSAVEEHFVPPTPPPMPTLDPISRLAWLGVLGGPGFLVLVALTHWVVGTWVLGLAVVAFVAGFLTLVVRLGRRDDDPDSGGDHGAVV